MNRTRKFDISDFIVLHREFTNEQTWTKKKRICYEALNHYLDYCLEFQDEMRSKLWLLNNLVLNF